MGAKSSFRLTNVPNRMFAIRDHRTDEDIIEKSYPQIRNAGATLDSVEARANFLREYKVAKLKMISRLEAFTDYEVVKDDQIPDENTTLASWLIKNQAKALSTEQMVLIDFRAPIEIEALLVADNVM